MFICVGSKFIRTVCECSGLYEVRKATEIYITHSVVTVQKPVFRVMSTVSSS